MQQVAPLGTDQHSATSTSRPRQARCPSQRPASTSAPASLAPAPVKPRAAGPPTDRAGASESPSPIAGGRTLVLGRRAKDKSRAADTLVQPGSTLRQQFSKHPRPAPRAPARSASRSARANSGRGRLYERGNTPRMGPPYRSSTAGASVLSTRARRQKLGGICCPRRCLVRRWEWRRFVPALPGAWRSAPVRRYGGTLSMRRGCGMREAEG